MTKNYGFLLIELIVVMSLILLISTLAIPSVWFLKRQAVCSEIEKLHLAFSYMQQLSQVNGTDSYLNFDIKNNCYSFDNHLTKLSQGVEFGFINGAKGPPSSPSKIINSPITFTNNKVTFYANGQIQPGTAYLVDSKRQFMYALSVPISQISFIRKYSYNHNSWNLIS